MTKTCAWCGKEFNASEGHQKYCSDLCKRLRHNQKCAEVNKRRLAKKPKQTRICIVCGKEFIAGRGGAIVCSDKCRAELVTTRAKQYYESHHKANIKQCIICGKDFEATGSHKVCGAECRKIRTRQQAKEFYQAYKNREKNDKPIEEQPKLDGKVLHKAQMTVDEYNRTHGTNYSYGMYVHYIESKGM